MTGWGTLADRLDHATVQQLVEMARGGIGQPEGEPDDAHGGVSFFDQP